MVRLLVGTLALWTALASPANSQQRWSVVLIVADDFGWADSSPYGNRYHRTPNLERLAVSGARFTNAYSAAIGGPPARAALMTGKSPARLGMLRDSDTVRPFAELEQPPSTDRLPVEEVTFAEAVGPGGYATVHVGAWGLGDGDASAARQGFTKSVAAAGSHRTMFAPFRLPGLEDVAPGEYLTDVLAARGAAALSEFRNRPLLLALAHFAVAAPIRGRPDLVRDYQQLQDPSSRNNAEYAASVEAVDQSVGQILDTIEQLGMADRTVVIFTSDEGGQQGRAFLGALRGGRGALYEGGLRVPLLIRWPGRFQGGETIDTPVWSPDLFPTILAMTRATDLRRDEGDGVNLERLAVDGAVWPERALYWHYPYYSEADFGPAGAIREGGLKLIESYASGVVELYDLAVDPGETRNLAGERKEEASRLRAKLQEWLEATGAPVNQPNPNFDPERNRLRLPAP